MTVDRDSEIWAARRAGETVAEIAARFGLRREKVNQICTMALARAQRACDLACCHGVHEPPCPLADADELALAAVPSVCTDEGSNSAKVSTNPQECPPDCESVEGPLQHRQRYAEAPCPHAGCDVCLATFGLACDECGHRATNHVNPTSFPHCRDRQACRARLRGQRPSEPVRCVVEGCEIDHAGEYALCPVHLHALVKVTQRTNDAGPKDAELLDALVHAAIVENDRAVKQGLRGERDLDGKLWDTCFRHVFGDVLEKHTQRAETPEPSYPMLLAAARKAARELTIKECANWLRNNEDRIFAILDKTEEMRSSIEIAADEMEGGAMPTGGEG